MSILHDGDGGLWTRVDNSIHPSIHPAKKTRLPKCCEGGWSDPILSCRSRKDQRPALPFSSMLDPWCFLYIILCLSFPHHDHIAIINHYMSSRESKKVANICWMTSSVPGLMSSPTIITLVCSLCHRIIVSPASSLFFQLVGCMT